ncbi:MAG: ribosomal L7Ae/L30e/S12e/Gadd45 family protein [Gemmatimonadetes bacterium]|nr:ribosomal L7Ae/L30e/S12e/Gadd45 family protein [Gemmatimonadota bacterium]
MSVGGWLGLARRAGAVAVGSAAVREALRARRAYLVLLATDASAGQRQKLEVLSARSSVPVGVCGDRASLGAAVGAPPTAVVALTRRSFAAKLLEALRADPRENVFAVHRR